MSCPRCGGFLIIVNYSPWIWSVRDWNFVGQHPAAPAERSQQKTPEISGRRLDDRTGNFGCDVRCFQIATSRLIKQRCREPPLLSSCLPWFSQQHPSFVGHLGPERTASKVLDTESVAAAQGQASQKGTGGAMADPVGVPRRWRIRGSSGEDHGIILPFRLKTLGFCGWKTKQSERKHGNEGNVLWYVSYVGEWYCMASCGIWWDPVETLYGYYGNLWDRLKPPKKMDKGECFQSVLNDVPFLKRLQFA